MNLRGIKNDTNLVFDELSEYADEVWSVLNRSKIVISNNLGACKWHNCTVEKPCTVCRSLRQLDEDIDSLL